MMRKRSALLVLLVLLLACGEGPEATKTVRADGSPDGTQLFDVYCTLCHGSDGRQGINGAKDLTLSMLSREEMVAVVTHGRNTMAAYNTVLDVEEIEAVVDHVRGLKKSE